MQDSGANGRKCPSCGADLSWEPRDEDDMTPVDSRFDRANEILRETALQVHVKDLEARVVQTEADLTAALAEVEAVKLESERLRLELKQLRSRRGG